MKEHVLAIDIGNSCVDIAFFENQTLRRKNYFPSNPETMDTIRSLAKEWCGDADVIIASVVPALSDLLASHIKNTLGTQPIVVDDFKDKLLPLLVDNPSSVGVDRIVNCYAAISLFRCPAIVVSLGTATTFEAISAQGEYLGGAIAPGVRISLEALTSRTALLPPVKMEKPDTLIATNTIGHMESGIYYGTVSMIEGITRRMKPLLGDPCIVIGTGGLSSVIAGEGIFDYHEPDLTLRGLEQIYRKYCFS